MRKLFIGLVAVGVLTSGQAFANPGEKGQLAVGAERMMGYSRSSQSSEDDSGESTRTYSNFSFLGRPFAGLGTPYGTPRIGVDYFPIDGLSVGGSLVYMRLGSSYEQEPSMGPSTESSSSTNIWLFAPRVGYALMFNDSVGIWPRGGVTYLNMSSHDDDDDSESSGSMLALSVEAPFLFAPRDNIAITAGPTIDYGLSTSSEYTDSEGNTTEDDTENPAHEFGIQAGLTVFF